MSKTIKSALLILPLLIITACNLPMSTSEPTAPAEPATPTVQTTPQVQETIIPTQITDQEAIQTALAAYLGVNANNLSIVINQNTGEYARGGLNDSYFLAAKINEQWQIVGYGQGSPDCQIAAQYGFSPAMVPECLSANAIKTIKFKTGGTYTFVENVISACERQTYHLRALAGQRMIVSVASDQKDVYLGIKGLLGGQQLLATDEHTGYWSGTLPQTQDYALKVTTDDPRTNYFMTVEIPANIKFEPGTTSTMVDGHIEIFDRTTYPDVENHVTYLLYASAGQTMDIKLSSPQQEALSLGVYGQEDGQPYQRYQVKNSGFYGVLPLTQGYYLKVFTNSVSADFTLTITIQ